MDVQVLLIGLAVFVFSAIVIYLISAFTMKEKTFEEVIAEQKRQQEEEREKLRLEKKLEKGEKEKRKSFKKKEKPKDKESPPPTRPRAVKVEAPKEPKMVNLELEPEIIEPLDVKPKSVKKDKVSKPILHNRDEKTPVSQAPMEQVKHTGPPPKDDLELKHDREQKLKQKKEKERPKQEPEVKPTKPIVEEMVRVESRKVHAAAPPVASGDARTTVKDGGSGEGKQSHIKLLSTVQSASLNEGEIQAMMDILLSKQGSRTASATSDWTKKSQKGDPSMALLRKQLEEKERALQEEQQMVMSANTKLKELNQEKSRYHNLEKNYKVKIDYQSQEIQALTNRMQQAHEQHMMETNQFRSRIQQLEGQVGDQSKVKMLAEDNKILRETLAKTKAESVPAADVNSLKQKVSIMETELSNNAIKLNASENAKKTLEQKVAKLEAEVQTFDESQKNTESAMEKRVEEVSQELRRNEGKNTSLNRDLQTAKKAVDTAHNEVVSLKAKLQELEKALQGSDTVSREMESKLKEAERTKHDMEGNLKNLQKKIEDSEKDKSELTNDIKALRQENSVLADELKSTRERQQGEGEEAPPKKTVGAPNGDVHAEESESSKILVTDYEKKLSDKDSEISRLVSDLETKTSELTALQTDVEVQKKKNNDLREKNWKAMDALEKSEKSVSEKVQVAKKEVVEEASSRQKEVESFDQKVLERLFPDVSVPPAEKHSDWMTKFESEARNVLSAQKSSGDDSAKYEVQVKELEKRAAELDTRLKEEVEGKSTLQSSLQVAEENYTKTQSQVSQYRSVLAETENKLTQLENSVESEEKKWQERLQLSQLDIDQLKEKSEDFEGKLKSSEDRCSQLQSQVTQMTDKSGELEGKLKSSEDRCSQLQSQITQMTEKPEELEGKLKSSEDRCSELQSQITQLTDKSEELEGKLKSSVDRCSELQAQITQLTDKSEELEGKFKSSEDRCLQLQSQVTQTDTKVSELQVQLEEKQSSSANITDVQNELDELRKQLEAEKKKNRDLAYNVVKLNGIIKTGHDALTQEQQLVEKLKTELASSSPSSSQKEPSADTEKMRNRIAELEKQVEKELVSNKLLSQRLAQLGVMASSQQSLNEAGTSV